jgi:hypothetical protein
MNTTLPVPLSITNKVQRYTIFFIAVDALHVQAVFPPIIRSSNCTRNIWYMSSLLAATDTVGELALQRKLDVYQILYVQFELLMMGGKTA